MVFVCDGKEYEVEIVKKSNKNTYIRVKDGKIIVTTNYFVRKGSILKLLEDNKLSIQKMIDKDKKRVQRKELFLIFGHEYDIVYGNFEEEVLVEGNKIFAKNEKCLNNWLNYYIKSTFQEHFNDWYNIFKDRIPMANLKIRKMKSRWGVCNTKNHNVTLNSELLRYDIRCLDYVIVHEFSHFIEPNHSKKFWNVVEYYYPNYKEIRKILKD